MSKLLTLFLFYFVTLPSHPSADEVIWKGEVNSNGSPTLFIKLKIGEKYKFKVSGVLNLGKWEQHGLPLANDACFEYSEKYIPSKMESIQNSMNISPGDGSYNKNHEYESRPFIAKQDGIHFWIYDKEYADNSGSLAVEIIQLD